MESRQCVAANLLGHDATSSHYCDVVSEASTEPFNRDVARLPIDGKRGRLTHYLFRYPAKFHPPVIHALLERYSAEGDLVLDPFCGSGTLLVEASASGRNSVGLDVDPLAVAVANAKVQRLNPSALKASADNILSAMSEHRRTGADYERLQFEDLSDATYERELATVAPWIPGIPNLLHWFRRYVVIDLAHLRHELNTANIPESHRRFLSVVFASVIRNASNADPVPVSGLEVTKWMKARDEAGRIVDPYTLFSGAVRSALRDTEAFRAAVQIDAKAEARHGDATALDTRRRIPANAVITSPPYHGAVDYYRRHQLEMFWLGLTTSQTERLELLQHYIGRPHVPPRHPWVREPLVTALAKEWEAKMRELSNDRADAFRHYLVAMTRFFQGLAKHLRPGVPAVLVVGHSAWNQSEIPTTALFDEISGDDFELDEVLSYPVTNRYMSYSRHNGASISEEYVLVLRRTSRAVVRDSR